MPCTFPAASRSTPAEHPRGVLGHQRQQADGGALALVRLDQRLQAFRHAAAAYRRRSPQHRAALAGQQPGRLGYGVTGCRSCSGCST